ncbi:MAG: hypothetical protein JWQ81_871 [Amycolatopsis sp.]|jgi:hypothetical protein|uniref:B-4DMT family transporter n=1 Tax=Amycolatopsis sp. TaxID=37632 RepID=UPI00260DEEBE|nr:B-4DMT family transporter [Amycolatopsis sp.]MCU1680132.1 hypothetical protein [Amycolatopsis sp.]
MRPWLIRGLGMALLHTVAAVLLAKAEVFQPTGVSVITAATIAVLVGASALWSALDAWLRRPEAGKTWFIAAIIAGPVSGVLSVAGKAMFVDQTGMSELGPALTGGAAFTALLVLIPAGLGLLVGGRIEAPHKHAAADAQRTSDEPVG